MRTSGTTVAALVVSTVVVVGTSFVAAPEGHVDERGDD